MVRSPSNLRLLLWPLAFLGKSSLRFRAKLSEATPVLSLLLRLLPRWTTVDVRQSVAFPLSPRSPGKGSTPCLPLLRACNHIHPLPAGPCTQQLMFWVFNLLPHCLVLGFATISILCLCPQEPWTIQRCYIDKTTAPLPCLRVGTHIHPFSRLKRSLHTEADIMIAESTAWMPPR
jgi:hypothetical protein